MTVLDYSRLFQVVPELYCAITNTLTLQQFTLSKSMVSCSNINMFCGVCHIPPSPSFAQSVVILMSPIVKVHQH